VFQLPTPQEEFLRFQLPLYPAVHRFHKPGQLLSRVEENILGQGIFPFPELLYDPGRTGNESLIEPLVPEGDELVGVLDPEIGV